jgi:catechol 2,3-dioxygenase-like lactoylglutathione lyase family enzyme
VDFYTRVLGFVVASRTLNRGPAQQRLGQLRGDLVDVVALQPASVGPPHVELLGYRQLSPISWAPALIRYAQQRRGGGSPGAAGRRFVDAGAGLARRKRPARLATVS